MLDNQALGAETTRLGHGQIELPRVVQAELLWSDKYMPAVDLRRL